ncbi:hypothetical protein [Marinimicrobium sp. ABcell2]|uniref:hypothetical protein n=1 Tax=Marinimicrobium sp. ABcell2 TaxID=3069751 RepID=UPI0027AFA9EF|nr:hypothetical protein [Marinimicrobium sp. ABcell2]MDQ2075598.1 hypothetical protein [Marinimicrobium sp. ABcell2]
MKMAKWLGLVLIATLTYGAHADQVRIPVSQQPGANVERPSAGMSKERVEELFGAPAERGRPVGDPPISKWDYGDYVVYFEHNTVLHSVLKHRPQRSED